MTGDYVKFSQELLSYVCYQLNGASYSLKKQLGNGTLGINWSRDHERKMS